MDLNEIAQLLSDPENQPHQYVGDPASLEEEIKKVIATQTPIPNVQVANIEKTSVQNSAPNEHSQEGVLEIVKKAICDELDERKLNVGGIPLSRRVCCENIARDAIQAYLTANPKPLPVGWPDISSAPRDGSKIILGLVYFDDDGELQKMVSEGRWFAGEEDGSDYMGCDAGFLDSGCEGIFYRGRSFGNPEYFSKGRQPTHWQPLPAPPALKSERE